MIDDFQLYINIYILNLLFYVDLPTENWSNRVNDPVSSPSNLSILL